MDTMRDTLRKDWLHLALLCLPFVLTLFAWEQLPDHVPFHWGTEGAEIDAGKGHEIFFMPVVNVAVWLFLAALPHIDPRRRHYLHYANAYRTLRLIVVLFLVVLNCAALFEAIGYTLSMPLVLLYTSAVLLVIPGYRIAGLSFAHPFGIRTPWTLEHPDIWTATHRFAARLWPVLGLLFGGIGALVHVSAHVYLVPVLWLCATILPVVCSYLVFRRRRQTPQ